MDISLDAHKLSGPQKAAVFMLAVGQARAAKLIERMTEKEIRDVYRHLAQMAPVSARAVEHLFSDFATRMPAPAAAVAAAPGREPPAANGDSRRGAVFERLNGVGERVIARYLQDESPETVAGVLSRLDSAHASRVLSSLPPSLSGLVVIHLRRLRRTEKDGADPASRGVLGAALRETPAEAPSFADAASGFVFDDLVRLDAQAIQTLARLAEKDTLSIALKGAAKHVREHFLAGMAERSARVLCEELEAVGTVRPGAVAAAQSAIVALAKRRAASGAISVRRPE